MSTGWDRVAEQIVRARSRLGYRTRAEFAAASGVSLRVLSDLETGARSDYRPATISRLEAALGWADGSVYRTVEGRRPIHRHDAELQLVIDAWPHLPHAVRRTIGIIARELRR